MAVLIDGQEAQSQGYTQDTDNYYIWYTTHFSTHEISIVFTATNPTPTATANQTLGAFNLTQIIYGIAAAAVVTTIVITVLMVVIRGRRKKANHKP